MQIAPVAASNSRVVDEIRARTKRQQGRHLQAVRERLTSANGLERSFEVELLGQFAGSLTGLSACVTAGIALLVCAVATIWISSGIVMMWGAMALTVWAARMAYAKYLLHSTRTSTANGRHTLVLLTALQSLVWSGLAMMFIGTAEPGAKIFVASALIFFGAATAISAHTVPAAVYASVLPLMVTLASFMWFDADMGTMTVAAVGIIGQLFFVFLSNRLYAQAVATLEFRAEKDVLIAELETATINSEEARRKAEDSNLAKSKFLATMSHELRTPLNAILGFSEVMKNEVFGPHGSPSYGEYAADIHASGQHLLNLINEILDLSRIEAGRYELQEEAVNLAYVVDECMHMLTLRARSKNQTVRQAVEPDLPKIWADERGMRQIVLNILSNAVKFTPQGGNIMVKVGWTASGGQYVSITDNGPGIPENELETALSSFGRGSQAIKTAEEGSGLGLTIVRGLIDLHGGVFTLKSKIRVGTEAIVTIPAERVMTNLPKADGEQRLSA